MGFPQIGQVLKDGYTVDTAHCADNARYVLAHRVGAAQPYVVWGVDQDGNTQDSRYFSDAGKAQRFFVNRCFDWLKTLAMPLIGRDQVDMSHLEGKTSKEIFEFLSKTHR